MSEPRDTPWNLDRHAGDAGWRRLLLGGLVAATVAPACVLMAQILDVARGDVLGLLLLAVFTLVFGWITISFWAAVFGFVLTALRRHPVTLGPAPATGPPPPLAARTAILMPVYNEDTQQAFGRVVATYRSVQATGRLDSFDFFVLSDTRDSATADRELTMWMHLRAALKAQSRLFYRRRPRNEGRKAGNIIDWIDMYGRRYRHMVVLDADSVMSGDTIVRLAALMEASPQTGIIQTLALSVGRETFFARALQFASRLYGPLLATGQSFWQLAEANYYGHNAIIRTQAFAEHCRLPVLNGKPPLGGEILSHDFVEAAFIRRGGWHVWLLPELGGSFEQLPANLVDYAARDRRWVQGNLQHGRLIGTPGLHAMSRLHFAMGIMGYAASPLWLLLLVLSSALTIRQELTGPVYFGAERSLFPLWPALRTTEIQLLLGLTGMVLLGPKLLALLATLASGAKSRTFGGRLRLAASAVVELAFSVVLAPVLMLLHSEFIAGILAGRAVGWASQSRDDAGVPWRTALWIHSGHMLTGAAAAVLLGVLAPGYLPWVATVVAGLVLTPVVTVMSSQRRLGLAAQRADLFVLPEEQDVPVELSTLQPARRSPGAKRIDQMEARIDSAVVEVQQSAS